MIIHRIHLNPMPAPRPRFRVVKGKNYGMAYNDPVYTKWKTEAARQLLQMPKPEQYDHVRLTCTFEVEQPKKTKLKVPKPDCDNYAKALMDSISQANWWTDDSQVVSLEVRKAWAPKGKPGSIRFTITEEL